MFKSVLILSAALCASIVSGAAYNVIVANDAGKTSDLYIDGASSRTCFCLTKTQTATITGQNGGDIRAFSSADCTGNFETIDSSSRLTNAQWVNSISFGASGVASVGPDNFCPNWMTYSGLLPY